MAVALAAPAVEVPPPTDAFAGPELDGAEPAVGSEAAAGAGVQFDGVTFLLCGGRLAGGGLCPEGDCAAPDFGDAGFDTTEGFCAGGVLPWSCGLLAVAGVLDGAACAASWLTAGAGNGAAGAARERLTRITARVIPVRKRQRAQTLILRLHRLLEKLNVAPDFGWRRPSRPAAKLAKEMGFSPRGTSAAEAATESRSLIAALKRCATPILTFSAARPGASAGTIGRRPLRGCGSIPALKCRSVRGVFLTRDRCGSGCGNMEAERRPGSLGRFEVN